MAYKHYTEQQKEMARSTDLCVMLRSQGESLKRSGKEYEWRDGSEKVTIRGNLWYHQYEQKGGDAIDFVRRFYGKSYPEAMDFLLGDSGATLTQATQVKKEEPKPFELPERNDNMRRVFAYLLTRRGLDRDVVYAFANSKMIYESANYHNVVFVGFDKEGVPRHANLRGTGSESTYKGNAPNSNPHFSFHWHGNSDRLYLFEAPIDMLSYITMHKEGWKSHSYAACCGVGDRVLDQMLKDNSKIKKVVLCLDNDQAGQDACKRISDKLFTKGIECEIIVPTHKDWNQDLTTPEELPEESEDEDLCMMALRLSS